MARAPPAPDPLSAPARGADERTPLLAPARGADERAPLLGPGVDDAAGESCNVAVYPLVHEIRVDIVAHIDTPLTYEQLIAPDSTYTIIRPLVAKYLMAGNPSVIFCLLLNKVQFISDSHKLSIATLSESRATLCEILATRVLRGWSERSLPLATVLLTSWRMFAGAPPEVVNGCKEEGEDDVLDNSGTALEMAIISSSKRFIRSASCQKVIEGIWSGKIIYSSHSSHALIQDNYKKRPIQIYNPHTAPVLDHYRLKVPKIRALLEYVNFVILFILYIAAIEHLDNQHITMWEIVFMVYAVAFSVDKLAATREHGMKVFASSLVNGFDLIFVVIFLLFLAARLYGTITGNSNAMSFGVDLLALGAVLMFPRLVFMTLANNLMILSIRSMLMEFAFLMCTGIICFLGFLYALYTLGEGHYKVNEITWWLLEIYFGLDATGFVTSSKLHPVLGPVLMVIYAFLSNTLLLTVAVAILGNTFAVINADAGAESMFRKAVATIEGVKADSVFSYQLPFNLIALTVLYPLSFVLNPRWFHKVNVMMIRVFNLPVLLIIALYERQTFSNMSLWEQVVDYCDHYMGKLTAAAGFEGFVGARMDVSAVFEVEREFGTYYTGWDDHGPYECDDEPPEHVIEDEEESTEGTEPELPVHDVTQSPLEGTTFQFPPTVRSHTSHTSQPSPSNSHSQNNGTTGSDGSMNASPAAPRRRRNSLSVILNPPSAVGAGPPVPPAAPLPRSMYQQHTMYGPSPLAQLFVRHEDAPGLALRRSKTIAVGSLPVSSSFPAGMGSSPTHRHRLSSGPSVSGTGSHLGPGSSTRTAAGTGSTGGGAPGSGLSKSLSIGLFGNVDRAPRGLQHHAITPIQEAASGATSGVGTPQSGSPHRPAIQFPKHADSAPPAPTNRIVSFDSGQRTAAMQPPAPPLPSASSPSASGVLPPSIFHPAQSPIASPERPERPERQERQERQITPLATPLVGPADKPSGPSRTSSTEKVTERPGLSRTSSTTKIAPSPRIKPSGLAREGAVPGLKPSRPASTAAGEGDKGARVKTASELLEAMEASGRADTDSLVQVAAIAKMEERQGRIEALLQQLLDNQVAAARAAAAAAQAPAPDDSEISAVVVRGGVTCPSRREAQHDTFDDL